MSYGSPSDRPSGESGAYYNPTNTFSDEAPPHDTAALQHAQQYAPPSTPASLFTTALHHLGQTQRQGPSGHQVDEGAFVSAHQAVYSGDGASAQSHAAPTLGMAAAMNALKSFTSGGGRSAGAGGGGQSEFIGLAMAQASKLFDEQSQAGNVASSANKQDAISQAAQMAFKLYSKSGSGGGGGPGGLLGKFL